MRKKKKKWARGGIFGRVWRGIRRQGMLVGCAVQADGGFDDDDDARRQLYSSLSFSFSQAHLARLLPLKNSM